MLDIFSKICREGRRKGSRERGKKKNSIDFITSLQLMWHSSKNTRLRVHKLGF